MEIDPPEYSQAVYRPPSGGNDSSLQDNEVDPSLLKVVKSHKTMATADGMCGEVVLSASLRSLAYFNRSFVFLLFCPPSRWVNSEGIV